MEEKATKEYLNYPVNKDLLPDSRKEIISDYFKSLANSRWSKDKRTKEERKVYFSQLAKKRWQKCKDEGEK